MNEKYRTNEEIPGALYTVREVKTGRIVADFGTSAAAWRAAFDMNQAARARGGDQ